MKYNKIRKNGKTFRVKEPRSKVNRGQKHSTDNIQVRNAQRKRWKTIDIFANSIHVAKNFADVVTVEEREYKSQSSQGRILLYLTKHSEDQALVRVRKKSADCNALLARRRDFEKGEKYKRLMLKSSLCDQDSDRAVVG